MLDGRSNFSVLGKFETAGGLEIAGQVIVYQQDTVLESLR